MRNIYIYYASLFTLLVLLLLVGNVSALKYSETESFGFVGRSFTILKKQIKKYYNKIGIIPNSTRKVKRPLLESSMMMTYTYEDSTSLTIFNGTCNYSGANTTFSVMDSFTITDLNVGIVINHVYRSDVEVRLRAPSGTEAVLWTRVGGTADNFDVLIDSDATPSISTISGNHTTSAPHYQNTFSPEVSTALNVFDGENSKGDWTLYVCDFTSPDSGTFLRGLLEFDGCLISDIGLSNIACNRNGTPANTTDDYITFFLNPTGTGTGGTYNVSVSSGTVSPTSASYGTATSFQLQVGSVGNGDVTVTVTDATTSGCAASGIVSDPIVCICGLDITHIYSDNCSGSGPYTADWNIGIQWTGAPDDTLMYQRNSLTAIQHIGSGITDTISITGIPADGGVYDTLMVWFKNETTCGDTVILKRPVPCPITINFNVPCPLNLAPSGTITASSDDWDDVPGAEIDGLVTGNMHHSSDEVDPWWQDSLNADFTVDSIIIWNRLGFINRLDGAVVELLSTGGSVLFTDTITTADPSGTESINVGGISGRKVRIRHVSGSNEILNFHEVQIFTTSTCSGGTGELCHSIGASEIQGSVWEDWNYNGAIDEAPAVGVEGVKVYLYDDCGSVADSTYTDSNGNYQFTGLTTGTTYRIEFSLPETITCWACPTNAGVDNGTTVQFVQPGNCASLGVASPEDYCQPNPDLVTTCYDLGLAAGNNNPALVGIDYNFSGTKKTYTTFDSLGSAWGVAYHKSSDYIFASSFLKRNSGFSKGEGYVHIINSNMTYVGSFNLQGVNGIDMGTVDRSSGPDYTLASNAEAVDLDGFAKVGTISFGDIDIFNDSLLTLVNLKDKSLINVDISDPSLLPTTGTTIAGSLVTEYSLTFLDACTTGEMRPFGLKYHKERGYLGVVCDASVSKNRNDLMAYVYSFDPNNPSTGLNKELEFDLTYAREPAGRFSVPAADTMAADWQPWVADWNDVLKHLTPTADRWYIDHASPILSDIEFTEDGSMVLGLTDRVAHQIGALDPVPVPSSVSVSPNLAWRWSSGDILKACFVNGNYLLEGATGCLVNDQNTAALLSTTDGPSGQGEFFYGEFFLDPTQPGTRGHAEIALGALVLKKGTNEVMTTIIDPLDFNTQGLMALSTNTGDVTRDFELVPASGSPFEKAVGLGDLELLCAPAPLEIGNYVWEDKDGDGTQDACEPPIAGINVTLYIQNGAGCDSLTTVMTNANGQYFFNENTPGLDTLLPDTTYYLVLGTGGQWDGTSNKLTVSGSEYDLTLANQGSNDQIDSDATTGNICGLTDVPFTTVSNLKTGCADHSYDFGLTRCEVNILSITSDCTDNGNGTFTANWQLNVETIGLEGETINYRRNSEANATFTPAAGCDTTSITIATLADGGVYDTIYVYSVSDNTCADTMILKRPVPCPMDLGSEPGEICASVSNSEIKGTVWEDWNNDGAMNEADTIGLAGIQVLLSDCSGNVDTTYTDANGNYQFTGLTADTTYRIELLLPEAVACQFCPSQFGANNGTTVQFVQPGNCASLGLYDYTQCPAPTALAQEGLTFATCFSGLGSNSIASDPNGYVFALIDTRDPVGNSAPAAPANWTTASAGIYHHSDWIASNLGEVFGLTLGNGNTPDIYTTAFGVVSGNPQPTIQLGSGGNGGDVYKIDGVTGAYSRLTSLPNTSFTLSQFFGAFTADQYTGLGQIDFNGENGVLYISNFEDGLIYVVDAASGSTLGTFDHGVKGRPLEGLSVLADSTALVNTQMGRMVFGLAYNALEKRLYYAVPEGTSSVIGSYEFSDTNQVWSVALNANGTIQSGSAQKEFDLASITNVDSKAMISDISFNQDYSSMLIAEMSMGFLTVEIGGVSQPLPAKLAHASRVIEYDLSGSTWTQGQTFLIGEDIPNGGTNFNATNSAGGVDYGYNNYGTNTNAGDNCEDAVVMSGDALQYDTMANTFVYGLQISDRNGNTIGFPSNSYFVDYDNSTGSGEGDDKFGLGDVEVVGVCAWDCPAFLEIGNYVWEDKDGDGTQDACEPPIAGVNVTLYIQNGSGCDSLTTVATNANGQYYFNENTSGLDTLLPDTTYYLVLGTGGQWDGTSNKLTAGGSEFDLTLANQGSNDQIDSDATTGNICSLTGVPFTTVSNLKSGCADHSYDFGLTRCEVNILNITSDCTDNGDGTFTANWQLNVETIGLEGQTVNYRRNSEANATFVPSAGCDTTSITIATVADGGVYDTIYVYSASDNTCADTIILKRPVPCPDPAVPNVTAGEVCDSVGVTQIGGTVFEDWNYDGVMNQSDTVGVQGITVYLYDCDNNLVETTYTDAFGNYRFENLTSGQDYRVEFSLPENIACWACPTNAGADNGTTVQFVQPGECASLGIASPDSYCQADPQLVTVCYVKGDASTATGGAVVSALYSGGSNSTTDSLSYGLPSGRPVYVDVSEVGSTWGVAYSRPFQKIFTSAYAKQLSTFGPANSAGAIYEISNSTNDGTDASVTTASVFVDLNSASYFNGAFGDFALTPLALQGFVDPALFAKTTKVGMGDLEVSEDGKTLYTINLKDRNLYVLPLQTDGSAPAVGDIEVLPMPTNICTSADTLRPFALKFYKGKLYIGAICAAEFTKDVDNLSAYVFTYSPGNASIDAAPVLNFPMNYDRRYYQIYYSTVHPNDTVSADWTYWVNDLNDLTTMRQFSPIILDQFRNGTPFTIDSAYYLPCIPTLVDIEFDRGDMILSFGNRMNEQVNFGLVAEGTDTMGYITVGAGDILRAGNNGDGTWTIEQNATVTGINTGMTTTIGQNNEQGPGGGEYYFEDDYPDFDATGTNPFHDETNVGGIWLLSGDSTVVSTAFDPVRFLDGNTSQGGLNYFNNNTGEWVRALRLYGDNFNQNYGKGSGFGDVEALCAPAPLEIGNYVWEDTDGDGIQDACEPGIAGVRVELYEMDGTLIAFDTTDAKGQYYFSHSNSTDQHWIAAQDSVEANTMYYLLVGQGQFSNSELIINAKIYDLTVDSTDSGANRYAIDSDAEIGSGFSGGLSGLNNFPVTKITTGDWGCVDHSFDVGFKPCPLPVVTAFAIQPSCTDGVVNTDGYLQISAVTNGDKVSWVAGNGFVANGGDTDYANATTIGTLPFQFNTNQSNPSGSRDYTLRVFNENSNCFTDIVLTMNEQDCTVGCDCEEYLYLNETTHGGAIHKFKINNDGSFSEVGNPWFDNGALGEEVVDPHGLGTDLNGFLYIGETSRGDVRKFTCDGNILPESAFVFEGGGFNFVTIGNILLYNPTVDADLTGNDPANDGIYAYDVCADSLLGYICLDSLFLGPHSNPTARDWGLYLDESTNEVYVTDGFGHQAPDRVWRFDFDTIQLMGEGQPTSTCIAPLINPGPTFDPTVDSAHTSRFPFNPMGSAQQAAGDGSAFLGITLDNVGNIYAVQRASRNFVGVPSGSCRILKYDPDGNFLGASAWDTAADSMGYFQSIGIIYSETANLLYVSTISPVDDCVAIFDTAMNYLGAAVPSPGDGSQGKGMAIQKECCPTNNNVTIDLALCETALNDKIFLQELINCEGTICEGVWTEDGSNIGLTYNACDNSVTITAPDACGIFTLESDGAGNNSQCGAFIITVNIKVETIEGLTTEQTICSGEQVDTLAVTTTFSNPDSIAFVYFNSAQTDSSIIYTGGTGIDTVQISSGNDTVRIFNVGDFTNTGTTPDTFYVYAIAHPTPADITCRPYDEILVIVNACDWGDLADTTSMTNSGDYQTSDANNGPVHQIIPELKLGDTIDGETDGQQSVNADGDGADEDGLTILPSLDIRPGSTFRLPLSVTNTTGDTAHLEAWIDWNGDGDFADTGEMVIDIDDSSGFPAYLEITVPTDAQTGNLLGFRVRLSNTDNMTPYGRINSGEVEDYLLGVDCPQILCLPISPTEQRGE